MRTADLPTPPRLRRTRQVDTTLGVEITDDLRGPQRELALLPLLAVLNHGSHSRGHPERSGVHQRHRHRTLVRPFRWQHWLTLGVILADRQPEAGIAATLMAMNKGLIAPTIDLDVPDEACDLDYVPNTARKADVKTALCNCIGFGSKNSALVLKQV